MLNWLRPGRTPHPEIFRHQQGEIMPPARYERQHSLERTKAMVWIPGGNFLMGSDRHYPEEAPAHRVLVDGFWLDRHPVTNLQFERFVRATGYVTRAETEGTSLVFKKPDRFVGFSKKLNWWNEVAGADWRHPSGPNSGLQGKVQHPVVHVVMEDAEAYAQWAGKDLPTEAEWEFAARGGLDGAEYAWGDELLPSGYVMANTWQGEFPWQNLTCDGFEGTSPVGFFPPNGYGASDMIGNVWEWTSDWYGPHHAMTPGSPDSMHDPHGGSREGSMEGALVNVPRKTIKGGSFLSAPNYCQRYRPAARKGQGIDSSTSDLGFRCALRPHA